MFASEQVNDQLAMMQVSSSGKLKCAQLQLPNERANSASVAASSQAGRCETKLGPSVSKCFRNLFEENLDKLKEYMAIARQCQCRVKSFSTSDILAQASMENEWLSGRKYLSQCDLLVYSKHQSSKEISSEYITYSCSTLAICGDTIHSSQLPSPQTQSIRQINSFIFSDLDLIKSISKKVRNVCIKQRLAEFVRSVNISSLPDTDLKTISKLSSNIVTRPIKLCCSQEEQHLATESGDILIQVIDCDNEKDKENYVTKHDKEMFVLNWLQSVESCPLEQE